MLQDGRTAFPEHPSAYSQRTYQGNERTFVGEVWPFWWVDADAMVGTGDEASSRGVPVAESPREWVRAGMGLAVFRCPREVAADVEDNSLSDKKASLLDGWGSAPACPALASECPAALIILCRKLAAALGVPSPWLDDRRRSGVRAKTPLSWEPRR